MNTGVVGTMQSAAPSQWTVREGWCAHSSACRTVGRRLGLPAPAAPRPKTNSSALHRSPRATPAARCSVRVCAASAPAAAAEAQPSGRSDAEFKVDIALELEVPGQCALKVSGHLGAGDDAANTACLAAMYCHYSDRALKLAAAARAVVEKHAALMNLAADMPEKLLEALSTRPGNSLKILGHFSDLLQLSKVATPAVADQIEGEMRAELEVLKAKGGADAATDTPATVFAALFAAESMPDESAGAAPTSLARRLSQGRRWEGWKQRMRTELIAWHEEEEREGEREAAQAAPRAAKARLKVHHRSADGLPMNVVLDLSASGPGLGELRARGAGADSAAAVAFQYAMGELTEPHLLPALASEFWARARATRVEAFTCTLQARGAALEAAGDGEELRTLTLALSGLLCGDFQLGSKQWTPADGRVRFRKLARQPDGALAVEVYAERDCGPRAKPAAAGELRPKTAWALVDCLDTLALVLPQYAVPEPAIPVPPASRWQLKLPWG